MARLNLLLHALSIRHRLSLPTRLDYQGNFVFKPSPTTTTTSENSVTMGRKMSKTTRIQRRILWSKERVRKRYAVERPDGVVGDEAVEERSRFRLVLQVSDTVIQIAQFLHRIFTVCAYRFSVPERANQHSLSSFPTLFQTCAMQCVRAFLLPNIIGTTLRVSPHNSVEYKK